MAPRTVRASLLSGMLGLQPEPTRAEVIGWLAYAVPMSLYLLIPWFRNRAPRPARTVRENAASRRVLEHAGLRDIGPSDAHYGIPLVVYRLERGEFAPDDAPFRVV